jgi:putative copper resistance protein D
MPTGLLILARAFHFGSGMILVGVVAFRWLVLLPAFAAEADETWRAFTPLFRRIQGVFVGAAFILFLSGVAQFWAVSAIMSGAPLAYALNRDTLATVFFQTQFGHVCQWRLVLAAILEVMVWTLVRRQGVLRRGRSWLEIATGLVTILLVVSIAGTGHAAAAGGAAFLVRITADALHLFAASIWPSWLLPFALFLNCARRFEKPSSLRPILAVAGRFSAISFLVVGILILTGTINSYFLVGSFHALTTADYGRLLCLKLGLFCVILSIAGWNRYRLLPLLFAHNAVLAQTPVLPLLLRLRSFVWMEFILAVIIVCVVSVLGITPPPQ